MRVAGAGAFPSAARATVLWAGIAGDRAALAALAASVSAAARRAGYPPPDEGRRAVRGIEALVGIRLAGEVRVRGHLPPGQVDRLQPRSDHLHRLAARHRPERAQRFVGRTLDVLVEGPSRTDASRIRGRSRHGKTVNFTGLAAPGELVAVEIHSATSTTLAGEESLLSRAAA